MTKQTDEMNEALPEATVIRQFALPFDAFQHFRACRRDYEWRLGKVVTNSQTLAMILREHRQHSPITKKAVMA